MARRRRSTGIAGATRAALAFPERVRRLLLPLSFALGCAGVLGLIGCALLAQVPAASWPAPLDADRLPLYSVLSLCVASLLGWSCVQHGETRVKRTIGRPAAVVVFLALPVLAAALAFLDAHVLETPLREWPGGAALAGFARWYTPVLVLVSLLVFLAWRTRPAKRVYLSRGAWFVVLVAPYVLLLAVVLFDLPAPWVEDALEETVDTIGGSSLAAQLVVAYFMGDGSGD